MVFWCCRPTWLRAWANLRTTVWLGRQSSMSVAPSYYQGKVTYPFVICPERLSRRNECLPPFPISEVIYPHSYYINTSGQLGHLLKVGVSLKCPLNFSLSLFPAHTPITHVWTSLLTCLFHSPSARLSFSQAFHPC